jgi:hypothetical protein
MSELLKVLNMTEEQQYNWLWKHSTTFGFDLKWIDFNVPSAYDHSVKKEITKSLADLAFRLRDEAVKRDKIGWGRGVLKVNIKCADSKGYECWWQNHSQPIHWIIAALIAGE